MSNQDANLLYRAETCHDEVIIAFHIEQEVQSHASDT